MNYLSKHSIPDGQAANWTRCTATWVCLSRGSRGALASACSVQQIRIATRCVPVSRPRSLDAPFCFLTARGNPGIVTKQGQAMARNVEASECNGRGGGNALPAMVTILSRQTGWNVSPAASQAATTPSIAWTVEVHPLRVVRRRRMASRKPRAAAHQTLPEQASVHCNFRAGGPETLCDGSLKW